MRKIYACVLLVLVGCSGANSDGTLATDGTAPEPTTDAPPANGVSPGEPIAPTVDTPTPSVPAPPAGNEPQAPVEPAPTPPVETAPPTAAKSHTRCGWIGAGDAVGEASFITNVAHFNAVHPKWWILNSDGITARKTRNNNNPTVIAAARANGVRLIPLIAAEGAADIRSMMNDAQKRAAHVQWLVQTAKDGGYDGWDIDYEHLWRAEDRAPFVAFMTELSTAMHAAGLELSMAIGGMAYDTGRHAYDYVALSAALDVLHIMGYDYHYTGSHQGPLAPLGWIDAVLAFAAKTGHIDRFVLGMANYAIAPNFFTNTRDALTRCTSAVSGETNHMESCEFDHYAAGRAPHCSSANGELWFEDLASMEEKMTLVQKHGARGVTYWTLGEELDGFFALVRRYFP